MIKQEKRMYQRVAIREGKEKPFMYKHPWVFSGAMHKVHGPVQDGDIVEVCTVKGDFIAWGLYNGQSQIRVRLYSWNENEQPSEELWKKKLATALLLRKDIIYSTGLPDAWRWLSSEADSFSGLTIDVYQQWLVVQFTSKALFMRKDSILMAARELLPVKGIYLRTEKDIREEEGIDVTDGLIWGEAAPEEFSIEENGILYKVSLETGQKTGFYMDQRENRKAAAFYAKGRNCLDVCSYTGAFAMHLSKAGAAQVTAVDVSNNAIELLQQNLRANHIVNVQAYKAEAFQFLTQAVQEEKRYDLIVLDPPKFTRSKAAFGQAIKGYQQLNEMAMRLLTANGILVTCSCSGRVSLDEFLYAINTAAFRVGRTFQVLEVRGASTDHPVTMECPESKYLKCVIGRVV